MRLHKTVLWSIQAHDVRESLRRVGNMNASAFRWHWTAGGAAAYGVASIRHEVTSLIEQMEVWLRSRVSTQLSSDHREGWWTAIPRDLRGRAERRYRVACEEFGKRRAGPAHSTDWLSFGDLLKVLSAFNPESWRRCVDSTVDRTTEVHRILRGIKSFRDARVAHLQSGGPTPAEIRHLLILADRLCEVLRPQDYVLSITFRRVLAEVTGERRKLLMGVYSEFTKPRTSLAIRLRTLDRILPPSGRGPSRRVELTYCDALIREAGAAAGLMGNLFGEA